MTQIESYINHHYLSDLATLLHFEPSKSGPSGLLCGRTISESLLAHNRERFKDISVFFCCQYTLNLINYGVGTYFRTDHRYWLSESPPFADCTACCDNHGGVSSPSSMLEYLRRESHNQDIDLKISDDQLNRYLTFFLWQMDGIASKRPFLELTPRLFCDAMRNDCNCPEYTLVWPPDDVDETNPPPLLNPWKSYAPHLESRLAQEAEAAKVSNDSDVDSNQIPCPNCGKTTLTESFSSRMRDLRRKEDDLDDSPSDSDQMCSSCRTPMFLTLCALCGAENRGVYACRACGASLGSVTDISPDTILIEEAEADPIQQKLATIRDNIPPRPRETTITTNRTRMNQSYPEGCFDPNTFLEAFDKVSLKEGYFLDYCYTDLDAGTFASSPDIFARKAGSLPLTLATDEAAVEKEPVYAALEFEKSPAGLFQLAVFYAVHDRFYLFAHANYGNCQPILTRQQYDVILDDQSDNLRPEALDLLKRQDIRPRVVMTGPDSGHVTMLYFFRYRGFRWIRSYIEGGKIVEWNGEEIAWPVRKVYF